MYTHTQRDVSIYIHMHTLGWPKHSFGFFWALLWKNQNDSLGQPNNKKDTKEGKGMTKLGTAEAEPRTVGRGRT